MKFSEAMKALEEGKSIRRPYWPKGEYIFKSADNSILDETREVYHFDTVLNEWELYKEIKQDEIVDVELCVLGSGTLAYLTDDGKIVTPKGITQCNHTFIRTGTKHKFNKTKNKFVEI